HTEKAPYLTATSPQEVLAYKPNLPPETICIFSVHNAITNFATQFHRKTGRGNIPVARNPIPKPHKRQNQSNRKNSTIPQSNFYSSWGLSPEFFMHSRSPS
ncbi:MAG: hypothetical protein J6V37_01450, partial [Clostridia bacterium]|nr:hypothetical protein [Clostridia bacterium]